MTPYYERAGIQLWHGDALETLRELPDGAANMCVTSPPYWGLRDYGTATWGGGDAECDHLGEPFRTKAKLNANWGEGYADVKNGEGRQPFKDACGKCGAKRIDQQLGLEATPEAYVCRMVEVFREVRRVLADDGTLWINIGDSYASIAGGYDATGSRGRTAVVSAKTQAAVIESGSRNPPRGMKPKDLVGIPWMLAFALRADGWYLRSDIIWAKPNPMPESVTDRPTKAHEYLFMLSKRATYFYNADAIREAAEYGRRGWASHEVAFGSAHGVRVKGNNAQGEDDPSAGRNKRTVWTISTEAYPNAHFATFPTALVTPCVLAGCPEGGTVLEPFAGSGTTLQVAKQLGRKAIGIELNAEYLPLITDRLNRLPIPMPLFTAPETSEQAVML